jgi:hypothetical protein
VSLDPAIQFPHSPSFEETFLTTLAQAECVPLSSTELLPFASADRFTDWASLQSTEGSSHFTTKHPAKLYAHINSIFVAFASTFYTATDSTVLATDNDTE